jgi:type VI secretion system protein ImpH
MGTEIRQPAADLAVRADAERPLREDPHSFSFFQAVRLLQRVRRDRQPVGEFANPGDEVVRFGVNPSLAFPAGQIQDVDLDRDGPADMEVNFMGLVGNESVLPHVYSRVASAERVRDKRPLTDFLNIFQHRMVSLAYKAWERARFYVPFERNQQDWGSRHVRDLIGLGDSRLHNRLNVSDTALVFYGGLLAMHRRSAMGLQQMLADYFGVPVEVEEFVGAWYRVPDTFQYRVDDEQLPGTIGLGDGAVLGDEIWDAQSRVRLRIGPLTRSQFEDFLPGGDAHKALRSLTQFYSNGEVDFETQLILNRDDVAGVVLGAEIKDQAPLGWSTWIKTRAFNRDPDETTLTL